MAQAIQCPWCGRKPRVSALPDAPTFKCESCGQPLKIPAQFRPSVMASDRHVRQSDPEPPGRDATAVLPNQPAPAAAPVAAAGRAPERRPTPPRAPAEPGSSPDAVSRPLRVLAWVVAMVLGLVITLWVARITGWLSGNRPLGAVTQ